MIGMQRIGRIGITYDEVIDAIQNLQANGETPTIERIRAYLGGRGSNSTISKHLNYWRTHGTASHGAIHLVDNNPSNPPDIVQSAIQHAWQQIKAKADEEIDAIKTEAQARVDSAEAKVLQIEEQINQLKQRHDELDQLYKRESAQKELLSLDLKQLKIEYDILNERLSGLQARHSEIQKQHTLHINDLVDAHKNEIAQAKELLQQQEQKNSIVITELKNRIEHEQIEYMRSLDAIREENKKLHKNVIPDLNQQILQKSSNEASLMERVNSLQKQNDLLSQQLVDEKQKRDLIENNISTHTSIIQKAIKEELINQNEVFRFELDNYIDKKLTPHIEQLVKHNKKADE